MTSQTMLDGMKFSITGTQNSHASRLFTVQADFQKLIQGLISLLGIYRNPTIF